MARKPRLLRSLALAYLVLVAASTLVRWTRPAEGPLLPGQKRVALPEYDRGRPTGRDIQVAFRDYPADHAGAPTLVLLHGSPMGSRALDPLIAELRGSYRLIVPDLPGFGGSTLSVADHSIQAHAHNLRDLLDSLGVKEVQVLGYSQGGGVALELAALDPERTHSVTLLSAIGAQEVELLGDYTLNHSLYRAQWLALWLVQQFTPHFGRMDEALFNVAYARNFTDSDQRPLRGILETYSGPVLILHGEDDALVPLAAAHLHAQLAPQSTLATFPDEGHLLPFTQPGWIARQIQAFLTTVEAGTATRRENTIQPGHAPSAPAKGSTSAFTFAVLVLGTQLSEDLSCVAAGVLVAQGLAGFWTAVLACMVGIFIGDLGLYAAGRFLGRPALRHAPLRWFLNERDVTGAEQWFSRRGAALVFFTRFLPGSRLPTYFAAGVLRAPLRKFVFFFLLAAAIWTPTLVGLSMLMGKTFLGYFEHFERYAPLALLAFVLGALVTTRLLAPLLTWEGRRLAAGRWQRWTRWEYWPTWIFYPPVVAAILWLGLRHRGPTLFAAANPAMPEGGFLEESKSAILAGLKDAGDAIGRWTLLPVASATERLEALEAFRARERLTYPLVLKPDAGQRGEGVAIVRDTEQAANYLARCLEPVIAQEFLPGREYGVFYYRLPGEEHGVTWGITDKRFTAVTGDGEHSLRHLILADPRAVAMAPYFLRRHAEHLADVPPPGERVVLAELGTHCRGSEFRDGSHLITPELSARLDAISQTYHGFYFGRYDLRAASDEALQRGEFRVIELNGVTSEATWIYDQRHSVFFGWKTLMRQWALAFEIGARNRQRGIRPASTLAILRLAATLPGRRPFEA